jgi:membrane protease YdiL (CAAX protease family)
VFASAVAAFLGKSSQLTAISHAASPPTWYVASSLIGLWAGFIGAAIVALRYASPIHRKLGLSFRLVDLWGVVIGVSLQIVVGLLYKPFLHHTKNFDAPIQKLTGGSHGFAYGLIIVLTVFGAPVAEEIFFRGVLLRSLTGFASSLSRPQARTIGIALAVVLDGFLFAASHGELAQLPGLALVGIVLSCLYLWTGRLGMSVLTHISFNGIAMVAYASSGVVWWLH